MFGLAIESADRTASAALWRSSIEDELTADGKSSEPLAFEALAPEAGKADQLILVVERLLAVQDLTYQDLDVIAVNRGPGSFTGIRSGVALGRGLALAAELPVLGVTTHEALFSALEIDDGRQVMIAQDARRGEVYAQAFSAGRPLHEIEARTPDAVASDLQDGRWLLTGSGAGLVRDRLAVGGDVRCAGDIRCDARAVMRAAKTRLSAGETPASGFDLRPLYIRAPDAVPPTPLIQAAHAAEMPG